MGGKSKKDERRQFSLPAAMTTKRLHQDHDLGIAQICKTFGISTPPYDRSLGLPDSDGCYDEADTVSSLSK